jgi:hypothetical protein
MVGDHISLFAGLVSMNELNKCSHAGLEKHTNPTSRSQGVSKGWGWVRARGNGPRLLATKAALYVLVVAKATGVGEEIFEKFVILGPVAKGAAL